MTETLTDAASGVSVAAIDALAVIDAEALAVSCVSVDARETNVCGLELPIADAPRGHDATGPPRRDEDAAAKVITGVPDIGAPEIGALDTPVPKAIKTPEWN